LNNFKWINKDAVVAIGNLQLDRLLNIIHSSRCSRTYQDSTTDCITMKDNRLYYIVTALNHPPTFIVWSRWVWRL